MTTIRDVAKLAGVSLGTVSNVLNELPTVSVENRERVEQAIAQLGYRRNQAASQLRSNRSNAIGLVIPDITNPFYPEVARGVDDAARRAQYNVFLCNKDRSIKKEEDAIEALLSKNVDGILLFKPRISQKRIDAVAEQCALVLLDTNPALVTCDTVNVEDYQGMERAVREVAARGHRRIAFISGLQDSFSSARRLEAYQETLRQVGLPDVPEYVCQGDFTARSGHESIKTLMALPQPPTAVMTANDMMALGAISGAYELGIRVPQELSVVGYDDVQNVQWSFPRLTTIWHPKYEMGESAVRLLIERIEARRRHEDLARRNLVLETRMKLRDTLAQPGSGKRRKDEWTPSGLETTTAATK